MLVFSCGCGINLLANGFKLRGIWKMNNVWPLVTGKVKKNLFWIVSFAQ